MVGVFISYQVIMGDLLEVFVEHVGASEDVQAKARLYSTLGTAVVLLYPLCLIKNISGLAMVSVLSIIAIIYVTILLIV